ncbi:MULTISPECIES: hypothetical protein [Kamptonema]|uniref:hypothetical protein n=1 Tax=Kamptonema TaxID=1501433 RepID=UPI0001DAC131|nr:MULTISPECIES: hypothetical protein [Kamptonema]CBN56615.1 hypothetical protein OSCI_3090008 [Kamptonema sp. PCC 6506]
MERFTSPIVTVLALYGLWCAAVNFGWLYMLSLKFPNFQQNPIVKTIETQIKKDLQQGRGRQLPTSNPSPSATQGPIPSNSLSPLVGVGGNVQTPFFSGEYNFKLGGSNGKQQQQQQQSKQPDNRAPGR